MEAVLFGMWGFGSAEPHHSLPKPSPSCPIVKAWVLVLVVSDVCDSGTVISEGVMLNEHPDTPASALNRAA